MEWIFQMSQQLPALVGVSRVLRWICLLLVISPQLSGQAGLDPRSMAMGGTGVAVANPATAAFFNPAVLSIEEQRRYSVEYPIIGFRHSDPDDLHSKLNSYQSQDLFGTLGHNIDKFNSNDPSVSSSDIITQLADLNSALADLGGSAIGFELMGAGSFGYSGQESTSQFRWQAYAIFAGGRAGGRISYRDEEYLSSFLDAWGQVDFDNPANNTPAQLDALASYITYTPDGVGGVDDVDFIYPDSLQSSLELVRADKQEVGVAISTRIGDLAVGITPKFTKIELLDYSASSETGSESDYIPEDFTSYYEDFNFDIGIAHRLENGWTLGLAARNLIAHEYAGHRLMSGVMTPTGNSLDLTPTVHLGAARQEEWWTVAVDLDLIAQDGVLPQLPGEQYLSTGVEVDLAGWGQLRGGYRLNLDDRDRNVASVGIGVSPFGLHVDVALAGNQNEVGAAVQL
jgi:hypothetical protein